MISGIDDESIRSRYVEPGFYDGRAYQYIGLSFFKSANDVLLTRGPIPPSCFEKVVDLTTGALIAVPEHSMHARERAAPALHSSGRTM